MDMIIYDSRANSGTTKHFAKQLAAMFGVPAISVGEVTPYFEVGTYVLCTYTIDYGSVPAETTAFLAKNAGKMAAVIANGSSNFRKMGLFGRAGDRIADQYNVELVGRLDMGGTKEDLQAIAARVSVLTGRKLRKISIDSIRPQSSYLNGRFHLKSLNGEV